MYRIAGRLFLRFLPSLFLLAVLFEGLNYAFDGGSSGTGAILVVTIMLALIFHRAILLDEKLTIWMTPAVTDAHQKKWPFGRFAWRFVLLFMPLVLVFGVLVFVLAPFAESDQFLGALLLALFVTTLLSPFWLAAAGTMLPAAAIGENPSFKAAFRRARYGYWRTVLRLFLGPILYQIAVIGLLIAVLEPTLGGVWEQLPLAIALLIYSVVRALGFFTPLLTATALSMAYQRAEAAQAPPSLSQD